MRASGLAPSQLHLGPAQPYSHSSVSVGGNPSFCCNRHLGPYAGFWLLLYLSPRAPTLPFGLEKSSAQFKLFPPNSPCSLEVPNTFSLSPRDQWVANCRACGSISAHNLALSAKSAFDICKEKQKGVWDRDVRHSLKYMKHFLVGLCPRNAWSSLFSGRSFSGALPAFKHQEYTGRLSAGLNRICNLYLRKQASSLRRAHDYFGPSAPCPSLLAF